LVYCTPTDEFAVELLALDGAYLGHEIDAAPSRGAVQGPQILVCTEGATTVHGKSTSLTLKRGMAAWVAADDGPIRLVAQEPAQLFRVTVGL
jgi:mannose-6-phosphate isomerase